MAVFKPMPLCFVLVALLFSGIKGHSMGRLSLLNWQGEEDGMANFQLGSWVQPLRAHLLLLQKLLSQFSGFWEGMVVVEVLLGTKLIFKTIQRTWRLLGFDTSTHRMIWR